ncbi:MAG: EAL domain-containing protein [Cyanobacteria bacterium Co-bin13]|nr:EAL domain-containing protein [Cyanobacteria bacterium Co-bin13]
MAANRKLSFYSTLTRFSPLKKSYIAKIMLVAFLGTHVPLLTLLLSFVLSNAYSWELAMRVLITALLATLVGTAITLWALHTLLAPVTLTSTALQNYLDTKTLPDLPTDFTDEAGKLMANTSQTLHKLDELIHYISNYDDLTGLPNRDLFCDRIRQTLVEPQNDQHLIAVLLVAIDDFTSISHVWQSETANALLRQVAQRVAACTSPTDSPARLGGDEFAIALTNIHTFEAIIRQSQLLLKTLAKPFCVEGQIIHITASIGITLNTLNEHIDINELLQQAHMALHTAKDQGRSQYRFYSPEVAARLQQRIALENELHKALERNEMQVYYQPLIDLESGQVTAMEALLRWQHPVLGMVSPAQFIPIAESNGLIVELGEWVLRTACAQNQAWQRAGLPPIRISVNLSARQFEQSALVEIVGQVLAETGLHPDYLELEVTESALMNDMAHSIKTLEQLRMLGIVLALDDFGTGYSSLNYLKQFPVSMLKIDRSFVQDVTSNPDSAAVANAIIALAKSLRLKITAEGIETQEQLDYLKLQGCDEGQGFYFARPTPAAACTELLMQASKQLQTV